MEAVWLEISISKSTPIVVGFCYRNPTSRVDWIHAFTAMMDNVLFESKQIILLGDVNVDLQKSNLQWTNNLDTYNLHQLIKLPTTVTQNSATLIDHIYVSETRHAIETCVPISSISDHYPVCVTWSTKGAKIPKTGHKIIRYRCLTSFNEQLFLQDLLSSPPSTVYNKTDTEDALIFWIASLVTIYNKQAPYKRKRVKSFPKQNGFLKNCKRQFT